jgi:hypothetical protein
MTDSRLAQFDRREGEDAYAWVGRQITMANSHELVTLYLIRSGDERQQRAMELAVQCRVAWWTRFAAVASSVTALLATVVAIVAIVAD